MAGRTGNVPRGVPAVVGWTTLPDVHEAFAERRPGLIGRHLRRMQVDRKKDAWRAKTARRARHLARTWEMLTRDLTGRAPERRKVEPGRWIIVATLDGGQRATVAEVECPIPRRFGDEMPIRVRLRILDAFPPNGILMRQTRSTNAPGAP